MRASIEAALLSYPASRARSLLDLCSTPTARPKNWSTELQLPFTRPHRLYYLLGL